MWILKVLSPGHSVTLGSPFSLASVSPSVKSVLDKAPSLNLAEAGHSSISSIPEDSSLGQDPDTSGSRRSTAWELPGPISLGFRKGAGGSVSLRCGEAGNKARAGTRQMSWDRLNRTQGIWRRRAGGLGLCWTPHSPPVVTKPAFVCLSK